MPNELDQSVPGGATFTEMFARAFDEGFDEWMSRPETRRYIRESIAGNLKRRSLMKLAHAVGCKHAGQVALMTARTVIGAALDMPEGSTVAEMAAECRRLREGSDQ